MSAIPILLADAVTAVLNTAFKAGLFHSLTPADVISLDVRRSYPDWDDDFKDLADAIAVDVVFVSTGASGGDLVELDSEGSLDTDLAVDVAVRYRFVASDRESSGRFKNVSVDRLVQLVEEIYTALAGVRMQAMDIPDLSANWLDTTVRTYCDYKRLREGSFLGVVRVRYNASKVASTE